MPFPGSANAGIAETNAPAPAMATTAATPPSRRNASRALTVRCFSLRAAGKNCVGNTGAPRPTRDGIDE